MQTVDPIAIKRLAKSPGGISRLGEVLLESVVYCAKRVKVKNRNEIPDYGTFFLHWVFSLKRKSFDSQL